MTNRDNDKRLIEDYIPIKAISAEASREKSIRHGHISTLHLWWARRPLVASRAAVFAALLPADAQPQLKDREHSEKRMSMTKFMIELCKWNVAPDILEEARRLIREYYPDGAPKVLDMFAGGGSIPLEALRLGCEAYALDLNPVAHIIELATLVYPQQYGKQLAEDVKKWGEWILAQVRAEVGDLYPLIPDPEHTEERATFLSGLPKQQPMFPSEEPEQLTLDEIADHDVDEGEEVDATTGEIPVGYLQPIAYLWTRTVTCPNPNCRAVVPLVRQTWLKKKAGDNVALEMKPHPTENRMAFYVRRAAKEADFGFDPAGFSQRGNSVCGRCGTTVASDYVKSEGKAGRMAAQMMAIVCVRPNQKGKVYLSADEQDLPMPNDAVIRQRIEQLTAETGITPPEEKMVAENMDLLAARGFGFLTFADLFTFRQLLVLLTFVKWIRPAYKKIRKDTNDKNYARAIVTYLGLALDKATDRNSTLCRWDLSSSGGRLASTFARQALPMVWDYVETNPLAGSAGDFGLSILGVANVVSDLDVGLPANVHRGSATELPFESMTLDAIITDPPYYDSISYADLSDYFYVWLKRSIGFLYPQHLIMEATPKKKEAISAPYRHESKKASRDFYESMMLAAFREANRVLKPGGYLVAVYAHKTTAGWSTLVDSLRNSGFSISETWPLDTELKTRSVASGTAALASSFFIVARRREEPLRGFMLGVSGIAELDSTAYLTHSASYESDVLPDMQRIVKERVGFFLASGITGADLNIATVGAGLAPYTRYARVELANGEELTASAYLDEVQAEVAKVLLGEAASSDDPTRYYLTARRYYQEAWVDFDEANNLARALGVELDTGPAALTRGAAALVEKKGSKVRFRDYQERGEDNQLGLPTAEQPRAPLVDVLQRILWLMDNDNRQLQDFVMHANVDKYKLRVVAEALKGRSLAAEPTPGAVRDERTGEQKAIDTLLAAWRRIVDEGKMF